MNLEIKIAFGILLPFLGTALGAFAVFFLKKDLGGHIQKGLLGFASGVMIAASVWSLIIPAVELSEGYGNFAFFPAAAGFLAGIAFLLILDLLVSRLHIEKRKKGEQKFSPGRSFMLVLAVTLHNFPEGMAVGVAFAGLLSGKGAVTFAGAMALSLGIAIQNIPEGAIISMPLSADGYGKKKSFLYGVLSGVVEPVGALLALLLTSLFSTVLPFLLSFAAGAMIYVVADDLIPQSQLEKHSYTATVGVALGFTAMMVLDVALG